MSDPKETCARLFGQTLDEDNFQAFLKVLAPRCVYEIGGQTLKDNQSIAALYEKNMKEGQQKFDELQWGKSSVKKINDQEYDVYFSDYLKHRGIAHQYRCKQRLTINDDNLVERIVHIELPGEAEKLKAF